MMARKEIARRKPVGGIKNVGFAPADELLTRRRGNSLPAERDFRLPHIDRRLFYLDPGHISGGRVRPRRLIGRLLQLCGRLLHLLDRPW